MTLLPKLNPISCLGVNWLVEEGVMSREIVQFIPAGRSYINFKNMDGHLTFTVHFYSTTLFFVIFFWRSLT